MSTQWNKVSKNEEGSYNDVNWKCEDIPELEGHLENVKSGVGVHNQTVYSIKSPDGTEYNVWDTTVLKRLLSEVKIGTYIKLVYLGKKKSSNGLSAYKDFDLFIADDNTQNQAPQATATETVTTVDNKSESDEVPF